MKTWAYLVHRRRCGYGQRDGFSYDKSGYNPGCNTDVVPGQFDF